MRKRTTELIGGVTILQTFTGEIKNCIELGLCNKFNNGKHFLTK